MASSATPPPLRGRCRHTHTPHHLAHTSSGAASLLSPAKAMITLSEPRSPSPGIFDPDDPESPDDPETCFAYDDKDLESEEAMWAMYERWCVFLGVKRDREDMLRRFSHFKDRARSIHEFNKSGRPWTEGLSGFGDQTPEERAQLFRPRFWRRLQADQ